LRPHLIGRFALPWRHFVAAIVDSSLPCCVEAIAA